MKVAIVDYGSGNLHSAHKAFERAAREAGITAEIRVTTDADWTLAADRIVLPGVGAFADCRRGLDAAAGIDALEAKWILAHLTRGGPLTEAERCFIGFIRDEAPTAPAEIKALYDRAA